MYVGMYIKCIFGSKVMQKPAVLRLPDKGTIITVSTLLRINAFPSHFFRTVIFSSVLKAFTKDFVFSGPILSISKAL